MRFNTFCYKIFTIIFAYMLITSSHIVFASEISTLDNDQNPIIVQTDELNISDTDQKIFETEEKSTENDIYQETNINDLESETIIEDETKNENISFIETNELQTIIDIKTETTTEVEESTINIQYTVMYDITDEYGNPYLVDDQYYQIGDTVTILKLDEQILKENHVEFREWMDQETSQIFNPGDQYTFTKDSNDLILIPIFEELSVESVSAYKNSFSLVSDGRINIDGNFSDWNGIPESYEYNWDNSANCWYYGVWVNGQCYKTPEGTYSTDVRHKVQLYCDQAYVYLHIIFSRDYSAAFNGEDYQFFMNFNQASFQVEFVGGGTITNNLTGHAPGIIPVEVRHRDSALSYSVAGNGYLMIKPDNINNELEIRIPIQEMNRQNPNITPDSLSTIEFFSPNLMYRRVSMAGTSTYPIILFCIVMVIALINISLLHYKDSKEKKHDL